MQPRPFALRRWITSAVGLSLLLLALQSRAEPAMWVIKDDDSTIYLLGTLHVLRPETVWSDARIKDAVRDSTELWLEVADHAQIDVTALMNKYGIDHEKPLSTWLSTAQKEELAMAIGRYQFPIELLEPMKPWYAALTVALLPMLKAGYNLTDGVETRLQIEAYSQHDKVAGLETMEEQIQLLSSLPDEDQVASLMDSIHDVEEGIAHMKELEEAWTNGDLAFLEKDFVDEMKKESPSLYQKILVDRNARWAKQIAKMLRRSGVQMIAVGAAHLVGPESVQAQLLKKGIKAERY
jgi:uncharacterized protein YbaP (TraB family)